MGNENYIRPRNINLAIRVSEDERKLIESRMKQAGMDNMRAFLVRLAREGRIINVEVEGIREMIRLLANATNNINQIAKKANTTGNIYAADVEEIRLRQEQLWDQVKDIRREIDAIAV